MAIADDGAMAGSVSGGCVEGAVVEEARQVLDAGRPRLVRFGVADDDAFAVGLSCGGTLEVWVEPFDGDGAATDLARLRVSLETHQAVARATVLDGPAAGSHVLFDADAAVLAGDTPAPITDAARGLAHATRDAFGATRRRINEATGTDLFVEWLPPPPRLVIVGAVHVAIPLVSMARAVGFETFVVDPRTAFATAERFGHADRLSHDWPDEALEQLGVDANTFVALLSHDLKLDVPALRVALSRARYVGALGSRKTHAKRLAAAREAGIEEGLLTRIHNPIGLDLGGRRAEEMAVAVLAEIVAVSHGRDARPLPPHA